MGFIEWLANLILFPFLVASTTWSKWSNQHKTSTRLKTKMLCQLHDNVLFNPSYRYSSWIESCTYIYRRLFLFYPLHLVKSSEGIINFISFETIKWVVEEELSNQVNKILCNWRLKCKNVWESSAANTSWSMALYWNNWA